MPGCERPVKGHNRCDSHYQNWYRYHRINGLRCTAEGCHKPATARDLCNAHYLRVRHHGTTERLRRPLTWERQQAILGYLRQGMTLRAAATTAGCNPESVRVMVGRGRRGLDEGLQEFAQEVDAARRKANRAGKDVALHCPAAVACFPDQRHPEPGGMVATDWGPVVQTAIGAAAAIGGGFLGAWVQGRTQERMERQRRREGVAELLASVGEFLMGSDPGLLAYQATSDEPNMRWDDIDASREAFRTRGLDLRRKLDILAVSHPAPKVRNLADLLEGYLADVMETGDEYLRKVLGQPPGSRNWANMSAEELEKYSEEQNNVARQTLSELLSAI